MVIAITANQIRALGSKVQYLTVSEVIGQPKELSESGLRSMTDRKRASSVSECPAAHEEYHVQNALLC